MAVCARHAHASNGCCAACLRKVQDAALDGRCTSATEDAAIEAAGGPEAPTYGELTVVGVVSLVARLQLEADRDFVLQPRRVK